jgi:hypothetical protein
MKVVINGGFGFFFINDYVKEWLLNHGMTEEQILQLDKPENRTNKLLVKCIEELNLIDRPYTDTGNLEIVECEEQPYYITEDEGIEDVVTLKDLVNPKYEF